VACLAHLFPEGPNLQFVPGWGGLNRSTVSSITFWTARHRAICGVTSLIARQPSTSPGARSCESSASQLLRHYPQKLNAGARRGNGNKQTRFTAGVHLKSRASGQVSTLKQQRDVTVRLDNAPMGTCERRGKGSFDRAGRPPTSRAALQGPARACPLVPRVRPRQAKAVMGRLRPTTTSQPARAAKFHGGGAGNPNYTGGAAGPWVWRFTTVSIYCGSANLGKHAITTVNEGQS